MYLKTNARLRTEIDELKSDLHGSRLLYRRSSDQVVQSIESSRLLEVKIEVKIKDAIEVLVLVHNEISGNPESVALQEKISATLSALTNESIWREHLRERGYTVN
jgi:hypothetical protein